MFHFNYWNYWDDDENGEDDQDDDYYYYKDDKNEEENGDNNQDDYYYYTNDNDDDENEDSEDEENSDDYSDNESSEESEDESSDDSSDEEGTSGSEDDEDDDDDEVFICDTIDLHGCSVNQAIEKLRYFLKDKKKDFRYSGGHDDLRFCDVITGRGVHSRRGYSVVKENVDEYLQDRGYSIVWDYKGGCVTIDLKYSCI